MTDYEIVSWDGGNILTCFSFKVQDEQYPGIDNETETKLEFGDLFNEKDVSLSSEDIIKKNLDQIVIDNNIKENKDC